MRIISGTWGGRRLRGPDDEHIRPTADRVREAMFNTLYSRAAADHEWSLEGADVLDLFAGTGAVGLEALSRGAASVVFVENDRVAREIIDENIAVLGAGDRSTVVGADVLDYLGGRVDDPSFRIDLVFADPPYVFDRWAELFDVVPGRRMVVESGAEVGAGASWRDIASRVHGTTVLTFFERQGPGDERDR